MSTGWDLSTKMMGAIRDAIGDIPAKCFFDIETASFEKDTTQATDLVLKLSGGDMAVRVRRFNYAYKGDILPLAFDWSIRFVCNGRKTEIHKLREGFARWYFIAIANKDETGLFDYCVIDMDKVRESNLLDDTAGWAVYPNGDGTSGGYKPMRQIEKAGCIIWQYANSSQYEYGGF
jgi:hypothetical protein